MAMDRTRLWALTMHVDIYGLFFPEASFAISKVFILLRLPLLSVSVDFSNSFVSFLFLLCVKKVFHFLVELLLHFPELNHSR